MARPRKEGMDYFPHDTNAANDKKIEALRMLYGNDGYAFYFIILEMIYQEPTFELDVSDAETIQILSKKVGINAEVFEQILQTALKRECFDRESYHERGVLTSNGIKKRAAVVVEKRDKMRVSYERKVSDAETKVETPQSKGKESKSKVKQLNKTLYGDHVLLTDDEHQRLITDLSEHVVTSLIDDINYYFIQKPSRLKDYKDHNRMIRNWFKRNEDRKLTVINGGGNGASYRRNARGHTEEDLRAAERDSDLPNVIKPSGVPLSDVQRQRLEDYIRST